MNIVEEEFTKGVIRIRKSTKDKTMVQRKKDDDLQNTTLKTGVISGAWEG